MSRYIDADKGLRSKIQLETGCNFATADRIVKSRPTADVIQIPEGATNGDMVKAMFNIPDSEIDEGLSTTYIYTKTRVLKGGSQDRLREQITFNRDWWNAPYKAESEDKE